MSDKNKYFIEGRKSKTNTTYWFSHNSREVLSSRALDIKTFLTTNNDSESQKAKEALFDSGITVTSEIFNSQPLGQLIATINE